MLIKWAYIHGWHHISEYILQSLSNTSHFSWCLLLDSHLTTHIPTQSDVGVQIIAMFNLGTSIIPLRGRDTDEIVHAGGGSTVSITGNTCRQGRHTNSTRQHLGFGRKGRPNTNLGLESDSKGARSFDFYIYRERIRYVCMYVLCVYVCVYVYVLSRCDCSLF